jgi:hypothetical protein
MGLRAFNPNARDLSICLVRCRDPVHCLPEAHSQKGTIEDRQVFLQRGYIVRKGRGHYPRKVPLLSATDEPKAPQA